MINTASKSISLVLFVDGASFQKTGSKGSIWWMFSCLLDLPPRLRGCFNNIETHFIVSTSHRFKRVFLHSFEGIEMLEIRFFWCSYRAEASWFTSWFTSLSQSNQHDTIHRIFFVCALHGRRRKNRKHDELQVLKEHCIENKRYVQNASSNRSTKSCTFSRNQRTSFFGRYNSDTR